MNVLDHNCSYFLYLIIYWLQSGLMLTRIPNMLDHFRDSFKHAQYFQQYLHSVYGQNRCFCYFTLLYGQKRCREHVCRDLCAPYFILFAKTFTCIWSKCFREHFDQSINSSHFKSTWYQSTSIQRHVFNLLPCSEVRPITTHIRHKWVWQHRYEAKPILACSKLTILPSSVTQWMFFKGKTEPWLFKL